MTEDTAVEYTGRHRKTAPDYTSAAQVDTALNLAEVNDYLARHAEG